MLMNLKPVVLASACLLLIYSSSCKKDPAEESKQFCYNTETVSPTPQASDSILVYIPTAFSPNGDQLNESFFITAHGIQAYNCKITAGNRLIFESNDPQISWDGKVDGNVAFGLFEYEITVSNKTGSNFTYTGKLSSLDGQQAVEGCASCRFPDQVNPDEGFVRPTNEPLICSQ
ncbi:MAG: hypothetical protein EP332_05730 [Bacteroidetes bacterium]|nr:MAG: hypothetical protein EP332_05730 [Bacteroidota bacterium]